MQRKWLIWLGVAATLMVVYFAVPDTPESDFVLYNGLGLISITLVLIGIRSSGTRPRESWLWFAAGLGSFLSAGAVSTVLDLLSNTGGPPVPSFADPFYLLMYPLMIVGLMGVLQRNREQLRHEARHDALTGLANRILFTERVRDMVEHGRPASVLFVDLDDFKNVNDSLGHAAGDTLLTEVAERLSSCVSDEDTVARFGGDEFAVLLVDMSSRPQLVAIARRAIESLNDPIGLGPRTVRVSASVGIAMFPGGDDANEDVESLLRKADVAMYRSKSKGKRGFEFFEPEMHEQAVERLDLRADLQRAIEEHEFVVHYQPIFDLGTGSVASVEALIRWNHPTRGLVMPERFITLAEETGQIVPIGEWVLRQACFQAADWGRIDGFENLGITVNLSMRQLQDSQLLSSLSRALKDSGLAGPRLVLEITESMLARDPEHSAQILGRLKTIGVKLALDDFGTGYSSLSYLRTFPVDVIKIDRSFINELHRSSTSSALIDAVVNLAKALGAYTVAEGIEYSDQAALLRRLGCDRGQGFYYCRPLTSSALTSLLREDLAEENEPVDAWRRSSELVQKRAFDLNVRRGLADIALVSADIDTLNQQLNLPLMASWPWLDGWARSFQNWSPLMIELRSTETGQLAAYGLLAYTDRAQGTAVVAMGHGTSMLTTLPAQDEAAGDALARGIATTLSGIQGAWSFELEQSPDYDRTVQRLAAELDHAQLLPELRVPRVVFSSAHSVDEVLSKSMRRQLRRARARIVAADIEMTIGFDRGQAISLDLIDEVEALHVSRDRQSRRSSDLDRPAERDFWRRVVEAPPEDWEVEIATLRLNGRLAAYVVALLDGDTYRIYDHRMNAEYRRFSPGRLVEAAALDRAMRDPRFAVLDWMSGVAAEKLLTANIAEGRARLVASSRSRHLGPVDHDDGPTGLRLVT